MPRVLRVPPGRRDPKVCCLSLPGPLQEPDKLGLSCPVVPDDHVAPGLQVSVEELVRGDRAVREIGLGQLRALLEPPEIVLGCGDQGDRDALALYRPCSIRGRVGGHVHLLVGRCCGWHQCSAADVCCCPPFSSSFWLLFRCLRGSTYLILRRDATLKQQFFYSNLLRKSYGRSAPLRVRKVGGPPRPCCGAPERARKPSRWHLGLLFSGTRAGGQENSRRLGDWAMQCKLSGLEGRGPV